MIQLGCDDNKQCVSGTGLLSMVSVEIGYKEGDILYVSCNEFNIGFINIL
jgi:hypothetical protein